VTHRIAPRPVLLQLLSPHHVVSDVCLVVCYSATLARCPE
jgi:hypothetical protein